MLAQVLFPVFLSLIFWRGEQLGVKALTYKPWTQQLWVVGVWLLCWKMTSEPVSLWPCDSFGALGYLFILFWVMHHLSLKARFGQLIRLMTLAVMFIVTLPRVSFELNTVALLLVSLTLASIYDQGLARLEHGLGRLVWLLHATSTLSIAVVMLAHANTSAPVAFLMWMIPMSVHHCLSIKQAPDRGLGHALPLFCVLLLINTQQGYVPSPDEPLLKTIGLYLGPLLLMVAPCLCVFLKCSPKKKVLLYAVFLFFASSIAVLAYAYEGAQEGTRSPYEDMYS